MQKKSRATAPLIAALTSLEIFFEARPLAS